MNRAWMLTATVWVGLLGILSGCQIWPGMDATSREPMPDIEPPQALTENTAATLPETASQPTGNDEIIGDETAATDAESDSPLSRQLQSYMARLSNAPSADAPQNTPVQLAAASQPAIVEESAIHPAQATEIDSVAAAPPSPTTPMADSTHHNAVAPDAVRKSAAAAASSATGHSPALAPNSEVAASPAPLQVVAPQPEDASPELHVDIVDVKAAPMTAAGDVGMGDSAGANQPVSAGGVGSNAALPDMIATLEKQVQDHPDQVNEQFRLRLLYLAAGQSDKATAPIEGADPVQQEMFTAIFDVLKNTQQSIESNAVPNSNALLAADQLHRLLAQQSAVAISKLVLVTQVNSFGDYKAVNPPRFSVNVPLHVFLYAEISNFRSEPTAEGKLRTWLSEKVEVYDATGKVIWQRSVPNIEDTVFTPRRDFFIPLEVKLPADIPAGDYVLKATVEDKIGATTDQQRLSFTIAP